MKDKTEGLMTMLLVAASCFFALLLCVEGQTVTHRQWIQLRGQQPWSALELEIPNTIQGHVVVNTAITFLGVNSTNPNPVTRVVLTAANSVLDQRRSKVAEGSSWTFNLSVGQDFAPVTLTDSFSPCAGDFLWNAKGFPFFYIVSFPSYPPPVWLDVQIQATVIDPSVKFGVPAQLPIRKNTYYTLTLPGNGVDEEVFLQALPGAPTIMNVFTKLTFALGCGPKSVIVNVKLDDQNATQLTAVASQSWVDGSRGNEMLVTVTAHTIPATPDYTITFRPRNNEGTS